MMNCALYLWYDNCLQGIISLPYWMKQIALCAKIFFWPVIIMVWEMLLALVIMAIKSYKKCVAKFHNSFTRSEWLFVFIFIRLEIVFWRKVGYSPIDFCDTDFWIYQITKPCKQLKKLPNNGNINPMFSHKN